MNAMKTLLPALGIAALLIFSTADVNAQSTSLGDVNLDNSVDFLDIGPFIDVLASQGFQAEADIDQNEVVNFLDIAPFIGLLSSDDPFGAGEFEGAVYTMTNDPRGNGVLAFGRRDNGTLEFLGIVATGGNGTGIAGTGFPFFDTGDGLDPLQSTNAIELSDDRKLLFVVNGGSASVSTFKIGDDLCPELVSVANVTGNGPNSLAYRDGVLYVSTVDADGVFAGSLGEAGTVEAFTVTEGVLSPIPGSVRFLSNRPAGIDVTPDGRFLVVTSLNAGSSGGPGPSFAENLESVTVFGLARSGELSLQALSSGISTSQADDPARASTIALGLETIEAGGRNFVVVTEARSVELPDGTPVPTLTPGFPGPGIIPGFQPGGVSSWEVLPDGELVLIDSVPVNDDETDTTSLGTGQSATCWVQFAADGKTFWVVNTINSTISSFRFNLGDIEIISEVVAQGDGLGPEVIDEVVPPEPSGSATPAVTCDPGTGVLGPGVDADTDGGAPNALLGGTDGFLDFRISDDGRFIYQTLGLARGIYVYRVDPADENGVVSGLTLIQKVVNGELPAFNIQGIAAF